MPRLSRRIFRSRAHPLREYGGGAADRPRPRKSGVTTLNIPDNRGMYQRHVSLLRLFPCCSSTTSLGFHGSVKSYDS
jgi:hypothetical protein